MSASIVTGMFLASMRAMRPYCSAAIDDGRQRRRRIAGPGAADRVHAVTARRRRDDAQHAFGSEEVVAGPPPPWPPAAACRRAGLAAAACRRGTPAGRLRRRAVDGRRLAPSSRRAAHRSGPCSASGRRVPHRGHIGRGLRDDPLALELALERRQVLGGRPGHEHDLAADEAVGAGRPGGRRARESGTSPATLACM